MNLKLPLYVFASLIAFASFSVSCFVAPAFAMAPVRISSETILKQASHWRIAESNQDELTKSSLKKLSKKDLEEVLADELSNSEKLQSLALEVKENAPQLEKAKIIAQAFVFDYVRKNWSKISFTYINNVASKTFDQFAPELRKHLQESMIYKPINNVDEKNKSFRFSFEDWAIITVDKNLKKMSYVVDLTTPADGNKLDPIANKIDSSSQNE